jgi:hypothetical protein
MSNLDRNQLHTLEKERAKNVNTKNTILAHIGCGYRFW